MQKTTVSIAAAAALVILASGYGWMRHTRSPEAKEVVTRFYHMWTDSSIHPLVEYSYRGSPYLTREMQRRLDRQARSFDDTGFDPVVCALKVPEVFDVSFSKGDSMHPMLTVDLEEGTQGIEVGVAKQEDGTWLIDSIACPEVPLDRAAAEALIRRDLYALSPAKPVAGSTFTIAQIVWDTAKTSHATVFYTDGTIRYQAIAEMAMELGRPVVKSFTIVPEDRP